jgi:hypothetical protein
MADEKKKPAEDPESGGVIFWNSENADRIPGKRLGSIFANRFHVLLSDQRTRLVFGESLVGEDDTTWYNAVTLPTKDAISLAKAILEVSEATDQPKQEPPADGKK